MTYDLSWWANLSQVITGGVAIASVGWYIYWKHRHRRDLRRYLKCARLSDAPKGKKGMRSATHLMARLGMSEAQLFAACFNDWKIRRVIKIDKQTGMAGWVLFCYRDGCDPR